MASTLPSATPYDVDLIFQNLVSTQVLPSGDVTYDRVHLSFGMQALEYEASGPLINATEKESTSRPSSASTFDVEDGDFQVLY